MQTLSAAYGSSLLVVIVLWTSLGWAQEPRYGGTLTHGAGRRPGLL